ncbi:MAG: hypothetical protein HFJ53_05220 [Clostridia bacterium]|nr:hypothetical protein [Clostridia bacterium]
MYKNSDISRKRRITKALFIIFTIFILLTIRIRIYTICSRFRTIYNGI